MGLRPRAFLAGSLGFAVAFVVACGGGSGLLSGQQAANLNAHLQSVSTAVSSGNCASARGAAQALQNQVAALPTTVNTTLASNLGQGASTLSQLADRNCTSSTTTSRSTSTSTSTSTSKTTTTSTISTTTVTNPTTSKTTSDTGTATNPVTTSTSPTSSNGGAGFGNTLTGNGNGQ